MAPDSPRAPTRKRGRPRKYASAEQRQEAKIIAQRNQRQSGRAVERAIEFDRYYPTTIPASVYVDEALPTYFPPGELTIPTDIEQLLPPLSLGLRPLDLSTDNNPPTSDEWPLAPPTDLTDEPFRAISPETQPTWPDQRSPRLETTETSLQVDPPLQRLASAQPETLEPNVANVMCDFARLLADQLQQHHGCCYQCHTQQESEHELKHAEHISLGEYIDQVQVDGGFPDVLSDTTIARREDNLAGQTSAERKREIYTGISSVTPDAPPAHICLAVDHQRERPTGVTFDIDSIVGFAESLAVAKLGVRWNPTQMPVSDLHSSLHLDPLRVHHTGSNGRTHHVQQPVHNIPHYTFGRLIGFEDISLYFLFPRLYREEQQSSRLRDDDFRVWMDQVLLPAIYQHCEGSLVQHYPSSFDHSRFNATARGVEMRSRRVDPVAREQRLFYFLPPDALPLVWANILETVQRAGFQHFLDVTILVQGKNLKTLTKANTWNGMMQEFAQHWGNTIDESYLSDQFYIDIGKETCPTGPSRVGGVGLHASRLHSDGELRASPVVPQTILWRRCCLESYTEWIGQQHPPGSSRPKQQFYPISLLHDTGSLTLETRPSSPQRQAGLLYTQFYSSVKEVFAAGDAYPFSNPALETLALDPQLRKTWQYVGGGLSHDPIALIRAYLNMKQRCHAALQGSYMKVFGLREEHRISLRLFYMIDQEFRERNLHQAQLPGISSEVEPFYSLPTSTLLFWFHWNINKFCVGFETVYSINDRHFVTWEHTRVMMMFLRCLQFSYAGGLLQRVSGCWRDVWFQPDARRTDGLRRCEGLGFQSSKEKYGYAWFLDKLNWDTMTFRQPSAQYMMFNSPSMQAAFHARYAQIRDVRLDFLRVHQAHRWMEEFSSIPPCLDLLAEFLRQLSLCVFRKDVFLQVKRLLHPDHASRALAGEVPLSYDSISGVFIKGAQPLQLLDQRRIAVKSVDTIFAWLWEWKDGRFDRKGWKDKPYRMVYQQSFEAVHQILGKDRAREWKKALKTSFLQSHWLLPYPHSNGFMRRSKDTGQEVWWSNFNAGLYEHYRQWYGVSRGGDPFPAEYIKHHPTTGWGRSSGESQYMENAMEPEMDLVRLPEGEFYEKLLQIADQFSQNPDAPAWKRKAPQTVFRFGIRIGDESLLKAQRKAKGTVAQDLCMRMIQALDEYEVLGHSGRMLRPRKRHRRQVLLAACDTEDEITSDEESIANRRDRLAANILELEPKMRVAVTAERKQYRWPLLHSVHLKHLEPRLQRFKIAGTQAGDSP
ncbi:hypothetical protein N7499_003469 [Penicillium canescens]|nr:uncharacterized protein N7446_012395 [Penicillium canescens]KAJ6045531.1 hypothetical protein N7446_012395 [Penicillium canescens]KAJ6090755.1 hypothetical protein N7499_003469 [Penicillium canescens]KAJ6174943.1 hypothetical protein N7485_004748 [Penicillium canescens]